MNKLIYSVLGCFIFTALSYGQTVQNLMDLLTQNNLQTTLNEFSGEVVTTVNGSPTVILNREENNNDVAADYLVEQFQSMSNLTITDQAFNTNGRNIIATQLGKAANPEIYIICAHYDTVANFCADDNATGTTAVLEIAKILSTQCFDNTIIYALWDEEEIGLLGSDFYADAANANGDNIAAVLNMDMMGYDGDAPGTPGDNQFDIDFRQEFAPSVTMKNDIISVFNTYSFDLEVVEVPNGTFASDHAPFWFNGFAAVLVGESWETNDQTPFYHQATDRAATLDLPYFTEIAKLVLAYTATMADLVSVDNTVTVNTTTLTSNQSSASYQWYNCDTDTAIPGATNQSYNPVSNGSYQVEVSSGNCTERSACIVFDTLSTEDFESRSFSIFPNPVVDVLNIESNINSELSFKIYDVSGKVVMQFYSENKLTKVDISELANGVYFLNVTTPDKTESFRFVKE
ncbi:M28 family peptidase [Ichthyenterobacterium sp. W332]|uniref:M28 family peptidase n=1 Tax=Microcosmobacter mediterraneus TaxID=3075607 RepID=A0ABU2YPF2_9FLAO|nr:M28 family peptidase [Ichthyenterobacterium sp. W332]MDT0559680.1 M28 family peptidase [Ichthyenterobacterium sp. W332]